MLFFEILNFFFQNADEVQNFCSLLKAEKTPKNPYAELSVEDQAKMDVSD